MRITEKIGHLRPADMESVKKAIALILDIEPDHCF